jgi:hypothetical protein
VTVDRPADETWFDRQPLWISLPVFLLLWPFFIVYGLLVFAFLILVFLPVASVLMWRDRRRFVGKLRDAGRVVDWPTVADELARGGATLLVEVGPKGPASAWLLDRPRGNLDPDGVVPTWAAFEQRGWDVLDSNDAFDRQDAWAEHTLPPFTVTARLPWPPRLTMSGQPDGVRADAVLVMLVWNKNCLSELVYTATMSGD